MSNELEQITKKLRMSFLIDLKKPEVDKYERAMDFYGFKATIKPTKRSLSVIRLGHLGVLLLLTIYMIAVYLYGEKFMLTLFNY